jgi:hypothetical protein
MKPYPVMSFLTGLFISALIFGAVFLLYMFCIFDLAGGETLRQIENQRTALLVITIALAIAIFPFIRKLMTTGRKSKAYGMSIVTIAALIGVGIYYTANLSYFTSFDKTVWQQSEWKPLDMAKTLVKEKKLTGLSRQEVKDMLGEGKEGHRDEATGKGSIKYMINHDWTLTIYFQKDSVVNAELRLPWLGV